MEFGLLQFQLLADLSATGTVCITCVIYTGTFHLRRGQNQNHENGGREEAREQEVVMRVSFHFSQSLCFYTKKKTKSGGLSLLPFTRDTFT